MTEQQRRTATVIFEKLAGEGGDLLNALAVTGIVMIGGTVWTVNQIYQSLAAVYGPELATVLLCGVAPTVTAVGGYKAIKGIGNAELFARIRERLYSQGDDDEPQHGQQREGARQQSMRPFPNGRPQEATEWEQTSQDIIRHEQMMTSRTGSNDVQSEEGMEVYNGFLRFLRTQPGHLMVIGHTRAGKSTLVHSLAVKLAQDSGVDTVVAIDPDAVPGRWPDCHVVGAADNFDEVDEFLHTLEDEIAQRREARKRGVTKFRKVIVIMDELPDLMENSVKTRDVWENVLRRGGKIGINMVCGATDSQVATLGIHGNGGLRDNFIATVEMFWDGANGDRRWMEVEYKDGREIEVPTPVLKPMEEYQLANDEYDGPLFRERLANPGLRTQSANGRAYRPAELSLDDVAPRCRSTILSSEDVFVDVHDNATMTPYDVDVDRIAQFIERMPNNVNRARLVWHLNNTLDLGLSVTRMTKIAYGSSNGFYLSKMKGIIDKTRQERA